MTVPYRPLPQLWSSSVRFVIVCAAAIVSLGDFWRLPYLVATYGGGAFLLVYAAALVVMGLPVFSAQMLMARGCHTDLPGVVSMWTRDTAYSRAWVIGAYATLLGALLLLAAYTVVASWSLAYSLRALVGALQVASIEQGSARFVAFARDGERGLGWLLLFVLVLVATTARGLRKGTEPVMRTLVVCILGLLFLLGILAWRYPPEAAALQESLRFDFAALGVRGLLEALYQAFFSLSLGTGVIISLASHLPARAPAIRLSVIVIAISQMVALLFGFVIARLLPGGAAQLGGGVQRIFEVLPSLVEPSWAMALLFALFAVVGMTTGIGLFEALVQGVSHRFRIPRMRAAVYTGVVIGLLGLLAQNSFGVLAFWHPAQRNIFDWFSLVSAHLLIPATGLMLCVLVGRVLARRQLLAAWQGDETATVGAGGFAVWLWLLRYPARIALIVVVAYSLGALTLIEAIWRP
ncbi:sodium-dependent transporter [Salinisphaera sp. SPP-AMP-43]